MDVMGGTDHFLKAFNNSTVLYIAWANFSVDIQSQKKGYNSPTHWI